MPDIYPSPTYRPWPWRLRPSSLAPASFDGRPTPGWIAISLVRVPRRYRWAKSVLYAPATLAPAVTFLATPPRLYLQAVNRAGTF